MANTTNNVTSRPMVKGTVSFYGKTKDFNGEKDIMTLSVENPEFIGITPESVAKMYGVEVEEVAKDYDLYVASKGKKNQRAKNTISGVYHDILHGEKLDKVYFHTSIQYEPDTVYTADNNRVDISEVELNKAVIKMCLNKSYIGAIKVLENGTPYNPFEQGAMLWQM